MNLFEEHWKLITAVIVAAFTAGAVVVLYARDGVRNWLLSGNGNMQPKCPVEKNGKTPLSKERHDMDCDKRWELAERRVAEREKHVALLFKKDQELILSEIEHLKQGQESMTKTVDKIFDKLDRKG